MEHWYPESTSSSLLRFIDHLMAMFSEAPCWDSEQKYHPDNLEVRKFYFIPLRDFGRVYTEIECFY